jgi:adenylate cyclase
MSMAENQTFVARDPELKQLNSFLDEALSGQGQICFVTGEAGAGKTALVSEFCRRAQDAHDDLVVTLGGCDAQTGVGDPYLPFREVLALLTGSVQAKLAQGSITQENARRLRSLLILSGEVLVEIGPDLIGLFVPGASLLASAGQFVIEKSEWADKLKKRLDHKKTTKALGEEGLDQGQIFEQYVNVMRTLAEKKPLILVLEDLQWADAPSVGLLFRLGRRLGGSRLLVVATFRPNDLALGRGGERHPVEPVLSEMKRYYGDIIVDLDQAIAERGREFVDAYLDAQLNCLDDHFRESLFEHTGGHPLFTVELLLHMRERGDLVQDKDGCWGEGPTLDWSDLPSRVEGVIEERIGRLVNDLRECLAVASVEGEQFTAEVVAQIESLEVRSLVRQLSGELQKEHRLVESQGVERLDGLRLSRYRFGNRMVQTYLYANLDEVEASYLHEDVGNALEMLYGDLADRIAVQLARHFDLAGVPDKARHYLQKAGEQAAARFANAEAALHLSRALALTPEAEAETCYVLLRARERVYDLLGEREAQAKDLAQLHQLATQQANKLRQSEVALRQTVHALAIGRYQEALAFAQTSAAFAVEAGDPLTEARAHHRWGRAFWQAGEYCQALPHLEKALHLARDQESAIDEARCLYDLGVVSQYQDDFDGGLAYLQQALRLHKSLDDKRGQVRCLSMLGIILARTGRQAEAVAPFAHSLELARQVGWRYAESRLLQQSGLNLFELGDLQTSRSLNEQAIEIYQEVGDEEGKATSLDALGLIAHGLANPVQARQFFQDALAIHRAIDNRRGQGYVLTHLGYALVQLHEWQAAAEALQEALSIRREMGAGGLVLDTLAGLALVAEGRSHADQAESYVRDILSWIEANGIAGIDYPVQVYWICYQVLHALAKDRPECRLVAEQALNAGHALLMERAEQIQDEALREQFVHNISFHRELQATWTLRQQLQASWRTPDVD